MTLRVSGLFRDVFSGLAQLFEAAAEALAPREDEGDENPYRHRASRVFAPRPGQYGVGLSAIPDDFTAETRDAAGEAWLAASSWAFCRGRRDAARIAPASRRGSLRPMAFVHVQDLPRPIFCSPPTMPRMKPASRPPPRVSARQDHRSIISTRRGPSAARAHADRRKSARVVRARAANPAWIAGMMRHGFRGAAEITATLEHMAAFAHLAGAVPPHLFDLYYDATLGDADVRTFMARENPAALAALETCFTRLHEASLWRTRRNSIAAALKEAS